MGLFSKRKFKRVETKEIPESIVEEKEEAESIAKEEYYPSKIEEVTPQAPSTLTPQPVSIILQVPDRVLESLHNIEALLKEVKESLQLSKTTQPEQVKDDSEDFEED